MQQTFWGVMILEHIPFGKHSGITITSDLKTLLYFEINEETKFFDCQKQMEQEVNGNSEQIDSTVQNNAATNDSDELTEDKMQLLFGDVSQTEEDNKANIETLEVLDDIQKEINEINQREVEIDQDALNDIVNEIAAADDKDGEENVIPEAK